MGLSGDLRALSRELMRDEYQELYQDYRRRHGFETYPSLAYYRTVLRRSRCSQPWLFDQLVGPLIDEVQARGCPLAHRLLIVAFGPVLMSMRTGFKSRRAVLGDVDAVVLGAFIEAVGAHRRENPRYIALRLRWKTWKRVVREAKQCDVPKHAAPYFQLRLELDEVPAGVRMEMRPSSEPEAPLDADERAALRAQLHHWCDGIVPERGEELLAGSFIDGISIRGRVMADFGHASERSQQLAYQRIKRQHSRAVAKLRAQPPLRQRLEELVSQVSLQPWAQAFPP